MLLAFSTGKVFERFTLFLTCAGFAEICLVRFPAWSSEELWFGDGKVRTCQDITEPCYGSRAEARLPLVL